MSISRIGNNGPLSSSSSSTSSSTTTQACAACKYQRRKCAPDCILAPYFPHDRQRQFLNAHKLFGVSNITKIIRNLEPPEKDEAMRTIIFQSDVRANDPVGGCFRIIRELQRQIDYHKAELDCVLHQLAICRAQAAAAAAQANSNANPNLNHHPLDDSILGFNQIAVGDGFNVEDDDAAWAMQDPTMVSTLNINNNNNNNKHDFVNDQSNGGGDNQNQQQHHHRRQDVKYESVADQELVERRFVPSTQLLISS